MLEGPPPPITENGKGPLGPVISVPPLRILSVPVPPSTPTNTPPLLLNVEPASDTVIVPIAPIPTPASAKKLAINWPPPDTVNAPTLGPEPFVIARPVKSAKDDPTKSAPILQCHDHRE